MRQSGINEMKSGQDQDECRVLPVVAVEESSCGIPAGLDWRGRRIVGLLGKIRGGRSAIALTDQIVISASNFATNIVLVRALGLTEYGKYSIAYSLLLYANALQMSFVASPMLSIAPLLEKREKQTFVNGMLSLQLLSSFLVLIVFGLIGVISHLFTSFYSLRCIVAFAFCVGTFQLQDWLRRNYFIYRQGLWAITSDFISYVIQLAMLFLLWRLSSITLFRTFMVMGITSSAGFLLGLMSHSLHPEKRHLREAWARCRTLSRGLVVANQIRWLGVQGVFLIGAGTVGVAAAGGIRATLSLAGPINMVLTSFENVMPLRIAEELKRRGAKGAFAFTRRAMTISAVVFLLTIAPVGVCGRQILRMLYGPPMVAFYFPMLLQLASIIVQVASSLWVYLFRGLHDTGALLRANACMAGASLVSLYPLGHYWGASGIVFSSLLGFTCSLLYFSFHWMKCRQAVFARHQPQVDHGGGGGY